MIFIFLMYFKYIRKIKVILNCGLNLPKTCAAKKFRWLFYTFSFSLHFIPISVFFFLFLLYFIFSYFPRHSIFLYFAFFASLQSIFSTFEDISSHLKLIFRIFYGHVFRISYKHLFIAF